MPAASTGSVVEVTSLREFFRDAFHAASEKQRLDIDVQSEAYVVNLLTMFSRADALYEPTAEGLRIKPLAHMLLDALEAPSEQARQRSLQRLGDVSLFIAGFFARSFARKLVDIDYHIAMGGNAYSSLADTMQRSISGRTIAGIFAELSQKFQGLVDTLNEVDLTRERGNLFLSSAGVVHAIFGLSHQTHPIDRSRAALEALFATLAERGARDSDVELARIIRDAELGTLRAQNRAPPKN